MATKDVSVEATITSDNPAAGESVNCDGATSDVLTGEVSGDDLMEKAAKAAKESDWDTAAESYSRALEIRVAHYGELAPECVHAYYKYGCALLYKAQDEADPLGAMPKKDAESPQGAEGKDGSVQNGISGESSVASAFSNTEQTGSSKFPEVVPEEAANGKDEEEDGEESDEDVAEAEEEEEEESDLDSAWKMLDLARAISEKNPVDTMEKVDILSALAEVALEREDVESSLGDYLKALAILERLVEPDSRRLAELNFRICICLEIGSRAAEAIPYCEKAISICKSKMERLSNELKSLTGSTKPAVSELDQTTELSSCASLSNDDATEKEKEIKTLIDLCGDLEKKLEDLQQLVTNPKSALSDILEMMAAKAKARDSNVSPPVMNSSQLGVASSSTGVDSPTVSTAHTNGAAAVTHLGVVGRGVKRVVMSTVTTESSPAKKLQSEPSVSKDDDKCS